MKKSYYILILLVLLSACKKSFLDRMPADVKTQDIFYKTPSDANQALVSAYSVLDFDGLGYSFLNSEMASDDCFGGGGISDNGPRQLDKFIYYNDVNAAEWTKDYKGIYRANILLQKMDGVDFSTQPNLKSQYRGEAKFLRAYFYFELVRMFGHVPLIKQPVEAGQYFIPQASPDSVYAFIAQDLKDAITDLTYSAVKYSAVTSTNYGHATKWAAESLLARVFLYYTGYYSKSQLGNIMKNDIITYLDDVINNSGYGLVQNYASLFRASAKTMGVTFAGQNNQEGVFTIQYSYMGLGDWNLNNGNRMQVLIGMRGVAPAPYYKGWGLGTINPKLWNAYPTEDSTRRKATIISVTGENLNYQPSSDQYQYTGLFWKKFTPLSGPDSPDSVGGNFQIDNFDNYPVIRYSDVLLMAAELNLGTDLNKAQNYYNQVRDRAMGNTNHRKVLTNDDAGKNLIFTERQLELALEGHRYWDLLRRGISVAKSNIDNPTSDNFSVSFPSATMGLFSIPQTQIGYSNGTLTQNTGWQ